MASDFNFTEHDCYRVVTLEHHLLINEDADTVTIVEVTL